MLSLINTQFYYLLGWMKTTSLWNIVASSINRSNRLLKRPSGCPNGTLEGLTTCFCEDHCSWERCRLETPPYDCLPRTNTAWVWDSKKKYWVAIETSKYQYTKTLGQIKILQHVLLSYYKIRVIFTDGYRYIQNQYCGEEENANDSSSKQEGYTFENCKKACSNDFECTAFAFRNTRWHSTTLCILYFQDECTLSDNIEWNLFIKEIGIDIIDSNPLVTNFIKSLHPTQFIIHQVKTIISRL